MDVTGAGCSDGLALLQHSCPARFPGKWILLAASFTPLAEPSEDFSENVISRYFYAKPLKVYVNDKVVFYELRF